MINILPLSHLRASLDMMPLILKYTSVYIFPKPGFSPISAQYNQSIEPVQILPTFPPNLSLIFGPGPKSRIAHYT